MNEVVEVLVWVWGGSHGLRCVKGEDEGDVGYIRSSVEVLGYVREKGWV